ncbi:MAG: hypothetical protein CSA38_02665 [Flavobacteriales bacterium]|nr:MAG: hypothetical protein CSA38_02665 [Flavobacteriales bacterium]
MEDEKYIRIAFLDDFQGEDSILISADVYGLLELEKIFNQLSKNSTEFELNNAKFIDPNFNIKIKMYSTHINSGLKLVDGNYHWSLTKNKWSEFREKASELYKNTTGGHQYLDSESEINDDLQVVLSLNEYDLNFWKKYGVEN